MSDDYSAIKDELSDKAREVTRLQKENKDLHQKSDAERRKYVETVRNLENNLNMKEPEVLFLFKTFILKNYKYFFFHFYLILSQNVGNAFLMSMYIKGLRN